MMPYSFVPLRKQRTSHLHARLSPRQVHVYEMFQVHSDKDLDYHKTEEGGCKFLCIVPGIGTAQGEQKSLLSPLITIQ